MTEQMLRQYTVLVEYLGATLGPDYEVVLHEIWMRIQQSSLLTCR